MDTQSPTPNEELNSVLEELVNSVQEILEDNFIGAYLQGSFAIGDFDEHSDVDIIIVIKEELSETQVELLQEIYERIYQLDYAWAQNLEGSSFSETILRSHLCDDLLCYLGHGSQSLKESKHDNTLDVRSVLYGCGVQLSGPPIKDLVVPVSVDSLRDEVFHTNMNWGNKILADPEEIGNHYYQAFAVLHFCWAIHALHTGQIHSKRVGAKWVKDNLDPVWNGVIDRAWSSRPRPEITSRTPADPGEISLTIDFVKYIMALLNSKRDFLESA